jgi:predicted nucleotidyltransferase
MRGVAGGACAAGTTRRMRRVADRSEIDEISDRPACAARASTSSKCSAGASGAAVEKAACRLRYGVPVEPEEIIASAGRTLAELAREPVKVVLFGSRARGDAEPESDYDFLVVEREVPDKHAEMVRLRRALRPLGVPCDVMVVSEQYADEWASALNSMVYSAMAEGRVLHAAS